MKSVLKHFYFVVLAAAIYPLHFLIHNFDYYSFASIGVGLLAFLALVCAVYLILLALTRNAVSALFSLLLFCLAFWSFNALAPVAFVTVAGWMHVTSLPWTIQKNVIAGLLVGLLATGILLHFLCRRWIRTPKGGALVVFFLHIMIALPLLSLAAGQVQLWLMKPAADSGTHSQGMAAKDKPDIYYIILDAYGRDDMLRAFYQFDNSPFINFLESKGFYVARKSHSNYGQTLPSLSSSLNFEYHDKLLDLPSLKTQSGFAAYSKLIKSSRVSQIMAESGYKVVVVESGYSPVFDNADMFIRAQDANLWGDKDIEFFMSLLEESPLPLLSAAFDPTNRKHTKERFLTMTQNRLDKIFPKNTKGSRTVSRFIALKERIASQDKPQFVFAHFLVPHWSFAFTENDSLTSYDPKKKSEQTYSPMNGDRVDAENVGWRKDYTYKYARQVIYTNRQIQDFVEKVLQANPNSIILVQGDHGPDSRANWDKRIDEPGILAERFSNLSAYYFPDRDYSALYPSITPVNSFRVILNKWFGGNYPMLPDKSFFARWDFPYDFTEVTDRLELPETTETKE